MLRDQQLGICFVGNILAKSFPHTDWVDERTFDAQVKTHNATFTHGWSYTQRVQEWWGMSRSYWSRLCIVDCFGLTTEISALSGGDKNVLNCKLDLPLKWPNWKTGQDLVREWELLNEVMNDAASASTPSASSRVHQSVANILVKFDISVLNRTLIAISAHYCTMRLGDLLNAAPYVEPQYVFPSDKSGAAQVGFCRVRNSEG
ncbi:hypothetical protein BD769DRAFT_1388850 [Suillus cothurnatus]|nr:hypothetical protein BD769DRAFT_1388850 [Suillus cothurnatus]